MIRYINFDEEKKPLIDPTRDNYLDQLFSQLPDLFISPNLFSIIVANKQVKSLYQHDTQIIKVSKTDIIFHINEDKLFHSFKLKPTNNCIYYQSKPAKAHDVSFIKRNLEHFKISDDFMFKERILDENESTLQPNNMIHSLLNLGSSTQCVLNKDSSLTNKLNPLLTIIHAIIDRHITLLRNKESQQTKFNASQMRDKLAKKTGRFFGGTPPKKTGPTHTHIDELPDNASKGFSA